MFYIDNINDNNMNGVDGIHCSASRKINQAQAKPSPPPLPKQDEHQIWKNLVEWVQQHGGHVHPSLELKSIGDNRGIYATESIPCNQVLLEIPLSCVISGISMPRSYEKNIQNGKKNGHHLHRNHRYKNGTTTLAAPSSSLTTTTTKETIFASPWLTCVAAYYQANIHNSNKHRCKNNSGITNGAAKNHQLCWKPYLDSLPRYYETLFQWSNSQVRSYLSGTNLGKMVQHDRRPKNWAEPPLQTRYKASVRPFLVQQGLLPNKIHNINHEMCMFQQACECIATRGFHVKTTCPATAAITPAAAAVTASSSAATTTTTTTPQTATYPGPFLLPIIDLLNHDSKCPCTTLQQRENGTFYMISERNIAKQEEVVHSYSSTLTSGQLLQTFGFVDPHAIQQASAVTDIMQPTLERLKQNLTSASLSKAELINACRVVAGSEFGQKLQQALEDAGEADEHDTWEISESIMLQETTKRQAVISKLPNEIAVDITTTESNLLSSELITIMAVQFLPDFAYQDVFSGDQLVLLDETVLNDFYLGHYICQALLVAIDTKLTETYRPIPLRPWWIEKPINNGQGNAKGNSMQQQQQQQSLDDCSYSNHSGKHPLRYNSMSIDWDISLLKKLQNISKQQEQTMTREQYIDISRAMYGLTIRIEEKQCLIALRNEIVSTVKDICSEEFPFMMLRGEGSGYVVFDNEDDDNDDDFFGGGGGGGGCDTSGNDILMLIDYDFPCFDATPMPSPKRHKSASSDESDANMSE